MATFFGSIVSSSDLVKSGHPPTIAQPTYQWGYVSVEKIFEKVQLKQDVPAINTMELVRVTKDNLGEWARQLKDWGFTDVPEQYLQMK